MNATIRHTIKKYRSVRSTSRTVHMGGIILLLSWGLSAVLLSATGTVMPTPFQTVVNTSGNPINGACVWTYLAGTTTAVATYTDVGLSVANTNPIKADSAGRFVAYLSPGVSYKFTYEDATCTITPPVHGVTIKTVDNIAAVPSTSSNLDVTGTVGEAVTAGQAVYLSDGSGGKTAGQWYKADTGQAYSSTLPEIGIVPSAIVSGAAGTVRLGGQATGLSSLTIGATYYIGTAGGITATAAAQRRAIGVADSTSTVILTPNPAVALQTWVDDFRLTLTTAVPVTTADVTAATTVYCSPLTGNRIDLPDSNGNPVRVTSAEFSIAVPATTSTLYDVFAYNNAGVATLELLAWTNDTTRATAVVRTTNGRLLKSGDNTRLYLGSMRTTAVSGQTEDSAAKRYLWNYYHRTRRRLQAAAETADSWTYTTATYRQANANAANQVDLIVGVAEVPLSLEVTGSASNGSAAQVAVSIGEDSTSVGASGVLVAGGLATNVTGGFQLRATLATSPAVGRHYYAWLEYSQALGTSTWYGDNGATTLFQSGIRGWYEA